MANSSTLPINQQTTEQDLGQILDNIKFEINMGLNCHAIAMVESVDYTNQTLRASLYYPKMIIQPDAVKQGQPLTGKQSLKPVKYPVLIDVPFISLRGGTGGLSLAIQPGDDCLILFNDRSIDDWFTNGKYTPGLSSLRTHSFSDAIALVGLSSSKKKIPNYDTSRTSLYFGQTKVALGSKIEISNAQRNLNTVLQQLISKLNQLTTQIAAITVPYNSGGPQISGPPANAAAINAIGSDLNQIASHLGELLQ